jgi:16S rRNA (cytosine967-C5)-methyltransferase
MHVSAREAAFRLLSSLPRPEVKPTEERLAAELGYGATRHRSRLDWLAEHLSERPKSRIDPPVLNILRLGLYQLLFMPSIPPYAAVSESVDLAKKVSPRASGFVNWTLRKAGPEIVDLPRRRDIDDPTRWRATFYSFPLWMTKRWEERFGARETEAMLAAMNTFPPLDLRVNSLRSDPATVTEELRRVGGHVASGSCSPVALSVSGAGQLTGLPAFREGLFYIQDESSQLAALALAPRRGEKILDACAGVGGKATHLAEIAGDGAAITAVDPDGRRLALLRENIERLGIRSVRCRQGDILDTGFEVGGPFDRILVDAPCSGLGTIRRHPELKWTKRSTDPARLAGLQLRLLLRAAEMLRSGGVLAYSTCTTEREENEEVVRLFLRQKTRFRRLRPAAGAINRLEELLTPEGFIATFPHRHGMSGSFVALLSENVRNTAMR